jgi:hypothetical protein
MQRIAKRNTQDWGKGEPRRIRIARRACRARRVRHALERLADFFSILIVFIPDTPR